MAEKTSLWNTQIMAQATLDSFRKLDPRWMVKNPVMFVVEVGSVLTSILLIENYRHGAEAFFFNLQITLWLWFTVLFANFAEAMAEGRGKAQADTLRKANGQDGLVANTAKYVNEIPIIAVNPDPARYDGLLLPFKPDNCIDAVEKVVSNNFNCKTVSLAEASLNDGQRLLAFNDLFIGASSHISARYKISYNKKIEEHSSSGIIVSTQSGSTGWLSSIFNMAFGMQQFIEHNETKKKMVKLKDNQLMFAVREPFRSKKTQANLIAGILTGQTKLVLESFMPNNGVIFSDGIENDFLSFNSGAIATIGLAKETVKLVAADCK